MKSSACSSFPLSWRERIDELSIGQFIELDEKTYKSIACIVTKHFHSGGGTKRFTIKMDKNTGKRKLWRKNDIKKKEVES